MPLFIKESIYYGVALLAEGVDRNRMMMHRIVWHSVALLAEGVDRNYNA